MRRHGPVSHGDKSEAGRATNSGLFSPGPLRIAPAHIVYWDTGLRRRHFGGELGRGIWGGGLFQPESDGSTIQGDVLLDMTELCSVAGGSGQVGHCRANSTISSTSSCGSAPGFPDPTAGWQSSPPGVSALCLRNPQDFPP